MLPSCWLMGSKRSSGCPQPYRATGDNGGMYRTTLQRCLPGSSALGLTCMACWYWPLCGWLPGHGQELYFAQASVFGTEWLWQLLLPGHCLWEREDLGGGWENVSGMLHPSYNPMFCPSGCC